MVEILYGFLAVLAVLAIFVAVDFYRFKSEMDDDENSESNFL